MRGGCFKKVMMIFSSRVMLIDSYPVKDANARALIFAVFAR